MNDYLTAIQTRLQEQYKYVDENWGQLNLPNPPVKWPCVLIDADNANYSTLGNNFRKTPTLRQEGVINIEITVANLRLTNSSGHAPRLQRDKAFQIYEEIEKVHALLQGYIICEGKLIRSAHRRIRRSDGVQEHRITYTIAAHDV